MPTWKQLPAPEGEGPDCEGPDGGAPNGARYFPAVPADQILPDRLTLINLAGKPIIITRLEGVLVAFSGLCPHAGGDLVRGDFYRGRIECPVHGYRFDVLSGRVLWPEDEVCRLRRYAAKEEDGLIKIKLR